jgi:hypothetical protein
MEVNHMGAVSASLQENRDQARQYQKKTEVIEGIEGISGGVLSCFYCFFLPFARDEQQT